MKNSLFHSLLARPTTLTFALLAFVAAFMFVPADSPFFTRGEAREALVVQAMVNQRNLTLPLRNGTEIPSKPPLFHWIGYETSKLVGGLSERIIRLPSILSASLMLVFFHNVFSRRVSRDFACLSAIVLFTSMDFLRTATVARVDMLFSLWVSLGTWILFEAVEASEHRSRSLKMIFVAGICMGLAALTKGPAGIALPIAVIALYSLVSRSWREIPFLRLCLSIGVAAVVALPWYCIAYAQGGWRFLDVHLMRENLARLVDTANYEVGHDSSRWNVIGMLLCGLFPFSVFLPLLASHLWKRGSTLLFRDPALVFSIVWVVSYLLLIALAQSRRNVYLLPSYPAWSYLLGTVLYGHNLKHVRGLRLGARVSQAFAGILALAAMSVLALKCVDFQPILERFSASRHTLAMTTMLGTLEVIFIMLVGFAAFLFRSAASKMFRGGLGSATISLAGAQMCLALSVYIGILPKLSNTFSPKFELADMLQALPSNAKLYQFRHDLYAIDFYANKIIPTIHEEPSDAFDGSAYIFVVEDDLLDAQEKLHFSEIVARSEGPIVYGKQRLLLLTVLPHEFHASNREHKAAMLAIIENFSRRLREA